MSNGYVYVLINPSMPGLTKVGKTSRSARDRVAELSAATGVPTRFILAYEREFKDCNAAEQFLHVFLETKGYRVAANREFFNAPLDVVLDAVQMAVNRDESIAKPIAGIVSDGSLGMRAYAAADATSSPALPLWADLLRAGECAYYGFGQEIQDFAAARKHFQRSAALGSAVAQRYLGCMAAYGEGQTQDVVQAVEHFNAAIRAGDLHCFAELARLFVAERKRENADKCWTKYFRDIDHVDIGLRPMALLWYLGDCEIHGSARVFGQAVERFSDELLGLLQRAVTIAEAMKDSGAQQFYSQRLVMILGINASELDGLAGTGRTNDGAVTLPSEGRDEDSIRLWHRLRRVQEAVGGLELSYENVMGNTNLRKAVIPPEDQHLFEPIGPNDLLTDLGKKMRDPDWDAYVHRRIGEINARRR